jgi:hypothetical protein
VVRPEAETHSALSEPAYLLRGDFNPEDCKRAELQEAETRDALVLAQGWETARNLLWEEGRGIYRAREIS